MSHFALPEWAEIITDPASHIGERVHVKRWQPGAVFTLESHANGVSHLLSVRRNRRVQTRLLLYKRRKDNAMS